MRCCFTTFFNYFGYKVTFELFKSQTKDISNIVDYLDFNWNFRFAYTFVFVFCVGKMEPLR